MAYKPGQSGNPLGRPKRIDPRSQELEGFCKEHREDIRRVGEIALERATVDKEPWAIKLCMEYFYPKPGTFVAISKEETQEVSLKVESFMNALPYEDQQAFLKIWMKGKKGIPAFSQIDRAHEERIHTASTINPAEDGQFIDRNTEANKLD